MNTRRSGGSSSAVVAGGAGGVSGGAGGGGGNNSGEHHSYAEAKPDLYPVNAKICQLVEQFPCMYDRSHPHYLKKDVVDKAWVKIAKEMDDSIPSCKERWRNIRTSFARSINVRKIPASANRTKPYYLHEELKFLTLHITPGIPVPRKIGAKKSTSSRNSTFDDEESEEIKVSMSEESFDSFAALAHEATEADEEDEDETAEDDDDYNDDGDGDAGNVGDDDDDVVETTNTKQQQQQAQTDKQKENNNNTRNSSNNNNNNVDVIMQNQNSQTATEIIAAAATIPTVIEVVPPIPTQPIVCPCPPKKRQRMVEAYIAPEIEYVPTPNDNSEAIKQHTNTNNALNNTLTTQLLQQQQQQQQQTTAAATDYNVAVSPSNNSLKMNDIDFDDAFLQGLRPEMKAMNFQQKVYFKRRIYDLLGEIFPHTNSLEHTMTTNTATPQSASPPILPPDAANSEWQMLRRLSSFLQQQPQQQQQQSNTLTPQQQQQQQAAVINGVVHQHHTQQQQQNLYSTSPGLPQHQPTTTAITSVLMPPRLRSVGRPVANSAAAQNLVAAAALMLRPKCGNSMPLKEEAPDLCEE